MTTSTLLLHSSSVPRKGEVLSIRSLFSPLTGDPTHRKASLSDSVVINSRVSLITLDLSLGRLTTASVSEVISGLGMKGLVGSPGSPWVPGLVGVVAGISSSQENLVVLFGVRGSLSSSDVLLVARKSQRTDRHWFSTAA